MENAFSTSVFILEKICFLICLFSPSAALILLWVKDVSILMQQKLPNNKDHYNTSRFLEAHWHRIKMKHSVRVKTEIPTHNYLILTGKANTFVNNFTAFKNTEGFVGSVYLSLSKLQTAILLICFHFQILYIGLLQQVEK